MEYICQQQPGVLLPAVSNEKLLFAPKAYAAMITFIQTCYEQEISRDDSPMVQKGKEPYFSSFHAFRMLLEHAMAFDGSVELHSVASNGLLALATHNPEVSRLHYTVHAAYLEQIRMMLSCLFISRARMLECGK